MKTNHRRGYVAPNFNAGQRIHRYDTFGGRYKSELTGECISASSTVSAGSSKGVRRDRAGAKKFIHSRRRRSDRDALRKIVREED